MIGYSHIHSPHPPTKINGFTVYYYVISTESGGNKSQGLTLIQKLAQMSMDQYGDDLTDIDPSTGARKKQNKNISDKGGKSVRADNSEMPDKNSARADNSARPDNSVRTYPTLEDVVEDNEQNRWATRVAPPPQNSKLFILPYVTLLLVCKL